MEDNLGGGRLAPQVSLDGLEQFFVAYEALYATINHDILGALGELS